MQTLRRTAAILATAAILTATPAFATSPPDEDLASHIRSALLHDPHVDPAGISIHVEKGVARLSGRVSNLSSKQLAIEEAEKIDGVVSVIDQLRIQANWRPDVDIVLDVRHRIVNSAMIESSLVSASCKDGVVTVYGTVGSWFEKQEAGILASEVRGVREIKNDLIVEYDSIRSDEEIRTDARARLDTDVYLSGLPIEVEVNDGVLTLTGSVGSHFEKDRAGREILYISHVKRVENKLRVEYWENRGSRVKPVATPSNHELKKYIERAVKQDMRLDHTDIAVQTSSGHVTLDGSVKYSYQKRIAEQLTRDTIGTAWVTNHLLVNGVQRSDTAIRNDVLSTFDSDYALSGMDTTVRVNGGTVTLGGEVNSRWEGQHAADLVTRVRGVKHIKNHIHVEKDAYSDASLAREVRGRLSHNWLTTPIHKDIHVGVKNGTATLTGEVATWSERAEAGRVALNTYGVWSVHNDVTVNGVSYPWDEWDEETIVVDPYWWVWYW